MELTKDIEQNDELPINESLVEEGENFLLDTNNSWLGESSNTESLVKELNDNSLNNKLELNNDVDNISNLLNNQSSGNNKSLLEPIISTNERSLSDSNLLKPINKEKLIEKTDRSKGITLFKKLRKSVSSIFSKQVKNNESLLYLEELNKEENLFQSEEFNDNDNNNKLRKSKSFNDLIINK